MTLRTTFQAAPQAIASYNYFDIAEGTGIQSFYLFTSNDDTTKSYHLTGNTTVYSGDNATTVPLSLGGWTKDGDFDFDIDFTLPKDIKGDIIVPLTLAGYHNSGGGQGYVIVKIRKWDGTTETEIASAQTATMTFSVGYPTQYAIRCLVIPVTTSTHFNKGDTLRVTTEIWTNMSSGSGDFGILHDPANQTVNTAVFSRFTVLVPFRIEL